MAIYQGNKKISNNYNIDASVYSLPIGSIIPFSGSVIPVGFLLCDGQAVSKTTYADLYKIVGNLYGESGSEDTFLLPDLKGRVLQGADGNLGTYIAESLPNITGKFYHDTNVINNTLEGAFSYTSGSSLNLANSATATSGYVEFDASKSNPIYSGEHVQQNGIAVTYIIKALKVSDKYAEEVSALIDDSSTADTNKVYSVNKIMEILTDWQDVTLNEEVENVVTVKKLKIGNIVYMHTHISGLRYTGQGGEGTIIFSTNDTDVINTNITGGDKLRGIIDVDDNTDASNIVRTTADIDYDPTLGTFRLYCFGEATRQFTDVALYGDIFSIIQK